MAYDASGGGETKPLDLQRLRELLEYSPDTGIFSWRENRLSHAGKAKVGSPAGTPKEGYISIIVEQRVYRAHRLAWLFMTGAFPAKGTEIDHINRVRSDNRWSNLRLVTRSQNNMNSGMRSDNQSGHKGVTKRRDTGKWHARITVDRRVLLLGNFITFEDAVAARRAAERQYFGEFAAAA